MLNVFTCMVSLKCHNNPKTRIPALRMEKMRLSKVKMLVQGHITRKWQCCDSNPAAFTSTFDAFHQSSTLCSNKKWQS